jgi:hypothetical protein
LSRCYSLLATRLVMKETIRRSTIRHRIHRVVDFAVARHSSIQVRSRRRRSIHVKVTASARTGVFFFCAIRCLARDPCLRDLLEGDRAPSTAREGIPVPCSSSPRLGRQSPPAGTNNGCPSQHIEAVLVKAPIPSRRPPSAMSTPGCHVAHEPVRLR